MKKIKLFLDRNRLNYNHKKCSNQDRDIILNYWRSLRIGKKETMNSLNKNWKIRLIEHREMKTNKQKKIELCNRINKFMVILSKLEMFFKMPVRLMRIMKWVRKKLYGEEFCKISLIWNINHWRTNLPLTVNLHKTIKKRKKIK